MRLVFHPYFNHFPVAFFMLEAFLAFLWLRTKDEAYERFAYFTLKAALVVAPVAMVTGLIDARGLVPMVRPHFFAALTLIAAAFARFLWRHKSGRRVWEGKALVGYVFLLASSVFLTILTGHLGGKLVY